MKYGKPNRALAPMLSNTVPPIRFQLADRRRLFALLGVVALSALFVGSLVPAVPGLASASVAPRHAALTATSVLSPPTAPTTFRLPSSAGASSIPLGAAIPALTLIREEAAARASGQPLGGALGLPAGSDLRLPSVQSSPVATPLSALAPRPTVAGTNANFLVTGSNCSSQATVVQDGPNPQDLLASGNSIYGFFNGSGGTPCSSAATTPFVFSHGLSAAYLTTNGGRNWTMNYLEANSSWTSSSSGSYGAFLTGDGNVVSSPSNLSLYATTFEPQCFIFGYINSASLDPNCSSTGQLTEAFRSWGVVVARSTDGGVAWNNSAQVEARPAIQNYTVPSGCTGNGTVFVYYSNITERPWVELNSVNHDAIVGWDVVHFQFNTTLCAVQATQASIQISVSTDGGLTWGAVRTIAPNGYESVQVAVGPAPTYAISLVGLDYFNATIQSSNSELDLSLLYQRSTDNGTTWSAAKDVGGTLAVHTAPVTSPAVWLAVTLPSLAVDNWSASAHKGSVYVVWADNQTGSLEGRAAIAFLRSPDGVNFGTPTVISLPGSSKTYFQPTVAVGPDGKVWVDYIGNDVTSGNYRMYGVYSSDGGATWSAQFVIGDSDSIPGTTIARIGLNQALVVTSAGAFAVWTDCRAIECGTSPYIEYLFVAQILPMTLATNAVGVPLTVTVAGWSLSETLPNATAFDDGIVVSLSAPSSYPDPPSHVWAFTSYSGAVSSANQNTFFTESGAPTLTVTFAAVQASWITGTFFPRVPSSRLTVDNIPVTLTAGNATTLIFNWSVAANQTYTINASAARYQPIVNLLVSTHGGQASPLQVHLLRTVGWIAGHVSPMNATVQVNGTAVTPNPTTGLYNFSAGYQWGDYWVNASSPGLSSFSTYVSVNPGTTTPVSILLNGGWIDGAVSQPKSSLRVSVDGMALNSTTLLNGVFNVSVRGGFHRVTSTETGYNLSTIDVLVRPGQSTLVNVTLTNKGWITGLISPQAALTVGKGTLLVTNNTIKPGYEQIDAATGTFNFTVPGGYNYTLTVVATGYVTAVVKNVAVTAGNASAGSPVSITLTAQTNSCPNPPCGGTTGGGNSSGSSNNLLLYGVIIAVIVLAAVVAAVLLMRGRRSGGGGGGGGGGQEEAPTEDTTYQSSPTADLPKLQSDGSFGGNPPPG
ncbi:MAG: hypothetical protein L3K23_00020 [Thermoplasmata archaeon]|nr:hypothetical protein [Thermoplasmata archaeon]